MANGNFEAELAKFAGPGISVRQEDLSRLTQEKIVQVKVSVGRQTGKISLPVKQVGMNLDMLGDDAKAFYADRMAGSTIQFIPSEYNKKLETLEARLRNTVKSMAILDNYVPAVAFPSLKARFAQIETDYLAARDGILALWDAFTAEFRDGITEMMKGFTLSPNEQVAFKDALMKAVPKKQEYADSFYMKLEVTVFPAYAAPEGLDSSLVAAIDESTRNNLYGFALQAIETSIGNAFALTCRFWDAFSKQSYVSGRTVDSMTRLVSDLGYKNVFQNELLTSLRGKLDKVVREQDALERQELVEEVLLDIWEYAAEHGIQLDTSCLPQAATGNEAKLTPKDLDQEVRIRASARKQQIKLDV
jgi:hypothetical protein